VIWPIVGFKKWHNDARDSKQAEATVAKLKKGKAEGRLLPDDLSRALELVKLSPRNGPMVLRMYNIVKF